jgi:hypothetical protein
VQRGGIAECLRVDGKGKVIDTQYRLASRERAYARDDRGEKPARRERVRHYRSAGYSVRAWQPWGWGWGAQRAYSNYYYRW